MRTFGSSGGLQYIDGLCFLPQNTINEKIFVFLYFWFIAMVALSVLNLARMLLLLAFRFVRIQDVRRMSSISRTRRSEEFCYWCSDFGIWYTLTIFHRNLSPVLFKDFMEGLMKIGGGKPINFSAGIEENNEKKGDQLELA